MSNVETGGPAFPEKKRVYRAGYSTDEFEPCSGMTLRDYFAAKAMQECISACRNDYTDGLTFADYVAGKAYECADAMLKARNETNPPRV